MLKALKDGQLIARHEAFLKVVAAEAFLKHYLPLIEIAQTQGPNFPGTDTAIVRRARIRVRQTTLARPTIWMSRDRGGADHALPSTKRK